MFVYFDANGTLKEIISDGTFRVGDSKRDKIYVYWDGEHTPLSGWIKYEKNDGTVLNEQTFYEIGNALVGKELPTKPLRNLKYFSYNHTYEEDGQQKVGYKFYEITIPDAVLSGANTYEKVPTQNNMVVSRIRFVLDENDEESGTKALGALVFSVETNIGLLTDSSINDTQYNYLISLISMKLGFYTKSVKVPALPSSGVAGTIYYVQKDNGIVYDAYFYNGKRFIYIGTTSYSLYTKEEGEDFENAIQALWTAEMATYEGKVDNKILSLQSAIQSAASGSPRGVYATVAALTSADPSHNYIYVVLADGYWYYYDAGLSAWTAGGQFIQGVDAEDISFDNSVKDILDATNVQDAIDEISEETMQEKVITATYPSLTKSPTKPTGKTLKNETGILKQIINSLSLQMAPNNNMIIGKYEEGENPEEPLGYSIWNANAIELEDGIFKFQATAYMGSMELTDASIFNTTDTYYAYARIKVSGTSGTVGFPALTGRHSGNGQFERISTMGVFADVAAIVLIRDYRSSGWTPIEVDYVGAINVSNLKNIGVKDEYGVPFAELTDEEIKTQLDKWLAEGFPSKISKIISKNENLFNGKYTLGEASFSNLVENGNLTTPQASPNQNKPQGFYVYNATADSLIDGVFTFTATAQNGSIDPLDRSQYNTTDLFYNYARVKVTSASGMVGFPAISGRHTGNGQWQLLSVLDTFANVNAIAVVRDYRESGWTPVSVDYIGVVNVSDMIRKGVRNDDGVPFAYLSNAQIKSQLDAWVGANNGELNIESNYASSDFIEVKSTASYKIVLTAYQFHVGIAIEEYNENDEYIKTKVLTFNADDIVTHTFTFASAKKIKIVTSGTNKPALALKYGYADNNYVVYQEAELSVGLTLNYGDMWINNHISRTDGETYVSIPKETVFSAWNGGELEAIYEYGFPVDIQIYYPENSNSQVKANERRIDETQKNLDELADIIEPDENEDGVFVPEVKIKNKRKTYSWKEKIPAQTQVVEFVKDAGTKTNQAYMLVSNGKAVLTQNQWSGSFNCIQLLLDYEKEYKIWGACWNTSIPTVIFTDAEDNVLGKYKGAQYDFLNGEILDKSIIPNGTVKVYVNGYIWGPSAKVLEATERDLVSFEANKKIVCLGDSITQGLLLKVYANNFPGMTPTDDYPSIAGEMLNAKTYNGGIGGTYFANYGSTPANFVDVVDAIVSGDYTDLNSAIASKQTYLDNGVDTQYEKIEALDFDEVDCITIAFGTNDWAAGIAMDNENDKYDKTKVLGALRYGVKELLTEYPHLKIYVFAPIYRYLLGSGQAYDGDTHKNSQNLTLKEFADQIVACAKELKVPVKNMYETSGINQFNRATMLEDGTHPTVAGYKVLGEKVAKFINEN